MPLSYKNILLGIKPQRPALPTRSSIEIHSQMMLDAVEELNLDPLIASVEFDYPVTELRSIGISESELYSRHNPAGSWVLVDRFISEAAYEEFLILEHLLYSRLYYLPSSHTEEFKAWDRVTALQANSQNISLPYKNVIPLGIMQHTPRVILDHPQGNQHAQYGRVAMVKCSRLELYNPQTNQSIPLQQNMHARLMNRGYSEFVYFDEVDQRHLASCYVMFNEHNELCSRSIEEIPEETPLIPYAYLKGKVYQPVYATLKYQPLVEHLVAVDLMFETARLYVNVFEHTVNAVKEQQRIKNLIGGSHLEILESGFRGLPKADQIKLIALIESPVMQETYNFIASVAFDPEAITDPEVYQPIQEIFREFKRLWTQNWSLEMIDHRYTSMVRAFEDRLNGTKL